MKFKLTKLKTEAFEIDLMSNRPYERLKVLVIYADGSVTEHVEHWRDSCFMDEYATDFAFSCDIDFTINFIELRGVADPDFAVGNLLYTIKCEYYEK